MRAHHLLLMIAASTLSGCGHTAPPPDRPALTKILKEIKFIPHDDYTGADTPEDRAPLQAEVDKAIKDIAKMPNPLAARTVRNRLRDLIRSVKWYATEDRDEVGRYAIRIWHAAGFKQESGLFTINDDKVLAYP